MKQILAHRLLAALLVLALLPVAAGAKVVETRRTIDIIDNKGGNVIEMVGTRRKLERQHKEVRIRGYCRSACTMLITMHNACLGEKAIIGFHAPRVPNTQLIPPYVPELMGRFYRNGILRKWNDGWRRSLEMQKITAAEYVRLDPQTRICDKEPRSYR